MPACRALLDDPSVAAQVEALSADAQAFTARAVSALLTLFNNGAKFDPPLGLMV
jgi:hypothetical protein